MRRLTKLTLIAALVLTSLNVGTQTALGCSCVAPDAEELFASSDGAFVGTLIDSPSGEPFIGPSAQLVPYLFEVEAAYKGEIETPIAVMSAVSGASCGFEMPEGSRASIFLTKKGSEWHGGLCSTMGPEALLAGPFEPIGVGEAPDSPDATIARWALAGVGGAAVVALGLTLWRRRPSEA